jgi:trehalose 6-phosphate phosphatase
MIPLSEQHIAALAGTPILLVACDFDGTLASLVDHPDLAFPCPRALEGLVGLARLRRTYAGVISGRSLADLRHRLNTDPRVRLIGSHGAEPDDAPPLCPPALAGPLEARLHALTSEFPDSLVESKPAGPALHYRRVDPARHEELVARALAIAQEHMITPRRGHMVIEFPLVPGDKGSALRALRVRTGATAVVFLGDDVTDEDAFAAVDPPGVSVKVGEGPTIAAARVGDVAGVANLLARLFDARRAHLERSEPTPIDRLALLSDQRSLALVDPGGTVVWLGAPRADSPPLMASLVGGPGAGFFAIAPEDDRRAVQSRYDPETFVLHTVYPGMTITDFLDCSGGRAYQRAGRSDLIRLVHGKGRARIVFAPRIDFGRLATSLQPMQEGLIVEGSADPIALRAPGIEWTIQHEGTHQTAHTTIEIPPDGLVLELRIGSGALAAAPNGTKDRLASTARFWAGWAGTLRLPSLYPALVRRSALVLKALCHGPTGAILAAGTTSLPEQRGGVRNWDYRFCWVRDAAMACSALVRLGSTGHAMKYLDWLLGIIDELGSPERLRPIYTVTGEELGPEGELPEMPGYDSSRPVRVGNAAGHQVQLDVFGPVAELIARMAEAGAPLTPDHMRLLDAMVQAVSRRWHEPDNGIWEMRGPLRHHVHSRVMCWYAVDRAIHARRVLGERPRKEEPILRDAICDDILTRGYNARAQAFTASYDSEDLDAASLLVGLTGLVSPNDPRFLSTVHAVEQRLRVGNAVMRYAYSDGLSGCEGAFHLCTGWLIESLHLIGRHAQARDLLDAYAAQVGPLGLYSEEIDPYTGAALGNYPQAYSHIALINAAERLSAG